MIFLTSEPPVLKLANESVELKHNYGKERIQLESFDSEGDWFPGFDDDNTITLDTSNKKEGSASFMENLQLSGDVGTTLHACDSLTDTSTATDCTLSLNETTFKEGTAAINATKGGTDSNCGFDLNFTSQSFTDNTHKANLWLYVIDQTTLDKISGIKCYLSDGTGWNIWDTSNNDQLAMPEIGWNFYRLTVRLPEAEEAGGADETKIKKFRMRIFTNQDEDSWREGDVIIDYLHRRQQSGYGSIQLNTYNGDWSGHSTDDKMGFWFYCPDVTNFYGIDFSFGDIVSGAIQSKALYSWLATGMADGWNYLSAEIGKFAFDGSYTMDWSNIPQLRFTTRYTNDTTTNDPYTPEEEMEINIDDLNLEKNIRIILT